MTSSPTTTDPAVHQSARYKTNLPVDSRRVTDAETPPAVWSIKRIACLLAAGIFFVLGVLGAILPGLPATPFLLLTSYFLTKSWPRLNEMMLRWHLVGPILRDWQHRGGVRKQTKVRSILVVVLAVAVTVWFSSFPLPLLGMVIALALVGVVVILRLPVVREE